MYAVFGTMEEDESNLLETYFYEILGEELPPDYYGVLRKLRIRPKIEDADTSGPARKTVEGEGGDGGGKETSAIGFHSGGSYNKVKKTNKKKKDRKIRKGKKTKKPFKKQKSLKKFKQYKKRTLKRKIIRKKKQKL